MSLSESKETKEMMLLSCFVKVKYSNQKTSGYRIPKIIHSEVGFEKIKMLYTYNKAENADFQSYAAGKGYIIMLRNAEKR